ncbi:bola protein [Phascolomyces articulosus]|uniref:Bola protein n=1 Tax=Phascolomyces articulosus TaxID=60185 RepID=A0AAD5K5D9_9FUNG|nr:bola protein [Phascolomyces articulosus]
MLRNVISKTLPIQQTIGRRGYASSPFLKDFITSEEKGPVETSMEAKLIEEFDPSTLHIVNESHMHSHHAAMKGNTNKETHFRNKKSLMQRHRAIYKILQQEIDEGVHALTLRTKTQAEIEKKV